MFILFINDLPDEIKSDVYLFADDTKIFRNIIDGEDKEIVQDDLENLENWSNTWLLKFHPEKCKGRTIYLEGGGYGFFLKKYSDSQCC